MPLRLKVLLIDDDPAQCETLADILADHHCDVLPCSDPLRGAELCVGSRFDLVLLDLRMARMSGIELIRRMRPHGHGCIIVLTGVVEPSLQQAALAEGADAVMEKPVDIPRLLEIARDVELTGDCKASAAGVPAT